MDNVCAQMFSAGDQIGSYRVRRRLGAGGMGEVYLAEHRHIDRKAAIKVLLPELSTDADVVARFLTEARAASRIKHPGIVEIVDCEIDPRGRAYIAMEFLSGESLGASLERVGSFDLNSVLGITGQIAGALAAAHAKGIIHRDLKPDNIFLASTPEAETPISVKVLDFGIAKLVAGDGEKRRTRTGSLLGTPLYMSPEQCRGAGNIDHRTDVYSLGCIIFELVAGRPPFVREGAGELIAAHLMEPAPDIAGFEPSIQPDLGRMVMQMLAKDPGARPQSMLDIVHEVEKLLGVPAARFLKAIQPPAGFPSVPEPDQDVALPLERSGGVSRTKIESLAGNTRVLPEAPRGAHPKGTTLSQTASELTSPTYPPSRSRRVAWLIGIPAAALLVGLGALVVRRPASTASRPAPAREESARPPEVMAVPQPVPLPPPLTPPPSPTDDSTARTGTGKVPTALTVPSPEGNRGKDRTERQPPPRKRKPARPTANGKPFTFIPD